ncbi:hypothetical protein niasHT_002058 [Heterodera trifolii]|uniref:C2H2-type domain-containing protein n=1 Tax=Heterodera trifolii TaxID=157864 RepID=A0ABD2M2T2_9BILA
MDHHHQQQKSEEDSCSAPLEWKDPLQMLAKQCDTISGGAEEERAKVRGKSAGGTAESAKSQQQTTAPTTGKGGTSSRKAAQMAGPNIGTTQQNGKTTGTHLGDGTPKQTAHQRTTGGQKAMSPSKDPCSSSPSTAAFFHAPSPAAFLPGAAFAPPPAHLAAAMMAGGFLGLHPPPTHRPPPQHFAASAIGMPNGHSPPLGLNNAMQQLMAAAMQQQTVQQQQQQMGQPQFFPQQLFTSSAGVPLPPSVSLKKPNQLDASALNLAMQMHPFDAFAGGNFIPLNGSSLSNGGDGGVSPTSALSIPALLMACASGQLPQGCLACTYHLKDGQLCGSIFPTEEQLFAHYKNAHIGKQSSPNVVSSTTSQGEQSVGTMTMPSTALTTSAGKKGPAGSPSSSRSTPTHQTNKVSQNSAKGATPTAKPHSNPGAMFYNNGTAWPSVGLPPGILPMGPPLCLQQQTAQQWKDSSPLPCQSAGGGASASHRFHPYAQQPNGGKQSSQTHHQGLTPNLQQMAMAINNLGLFANLGALPTGGFFPPGVDFAMLAQQHLGQSPAGAHPATPPATAVHQQQSQLAALAAMANSIGSKGGTSNGTTMARQQQTGGVATLEAVDG